MSATAQPTVDRLMNRAGREYGEALVLAWSGQVNDARSHVLIAKRLYERLLHPPAPYAGGHYLDTEVLLAAIETLMTQRKAGMDRCGSRVHALCRSRRVPSVALFRAG